MTGLRPLRALRGQARLIILAVLLAVILVLSISVFVEYIQVDEIELPDLGGRPFSEATALLRERDLVPVSYPENIPGAKVETITSQTPSPGSLVRRGRSVAIGVHRPPAASRAPVLQGLTWQQAVNAVAAVNLTIESIDYAHSSQPAGRVISQSPEPGERVEAERGLQLVVSRGPEQPEMAMPELGGQPLERALDRLQEMGLRSVERVATGVSSDAAGRVVSQEPAAGDPVHAGTPVILGYNLSPRQVVPVPELVGQRPEMAGRLLRAAGLSLGELHYVEDDDAPRGTIVEALPSGYTLPGTPVALTVNAASGSFDELRDELAEEQADDRDDFPGGPARRRPGGGERDGPSEEAEAGGRRVNVTFDPASLGVRSLLERDYDLRLVVEDDEGERTVIDRRVRAGERVSAVILVHGDAMLQTYINDVFFQAWRP